MVHILAATKLNLQPEELNKIKNLVNAGKWNFLGYSLNLETGELVDLLEKEASAVEMYVVTVLLKHYVDASPVTERGKLVKFEDLPGGHAYGKAFVQRAIQPLAEGFGKNPSALVKAGERLGGKQCNFGDKAVEVETLKGLPLVFVLWGESEFPASANVLFYESASSYLPTEDLAVLGELVSHRLLKAQNC
jgi:hypothetical protein